MPRKYDRMIRYYQSWFDDLLDKEKELTPEECWQVIIAIRDCQVEMSLEPLQALPISTRRALSMATMSEQVVRMMERSERMRNKSSHGGQKAAENRKNPEQLAAATMRTQMAEEQQRQREEQFDKQRAAKSSPSDYLHLLQLAAGGDAIAQERLNMTKEQAQQRLKSSVLIKMGGAR